MIGSFVMGKQTYPNLYLMQRIKQEVFDPIKTYFSAYKRRIKFISYLILNLLKITNCALDKSSPPIAQPTPRNGPLATNACNNLWASAAFQGRIDARAVWSVFDQHQQPVLNLDRTKYQMRGQWI